MVESRSIRVFESFWNFFPLAMGRRPSDQKRDTGPHGSARNFSVTFAHDEAGFYLRMRSGRSTRLSRTPTLAVRLGTSNSNQLVSFACTWGRNLQSWSCPERTNVFVLIYNVFERSFSTCRITMDLAWSTRCAKPPDKRVAAVLRGVFWCCESRLDKHRDSFCCNVQISRLGEFASLYVKDSRPVLPAMELGRGGAAKVGLKQSRLQGPILNFINFHQFSSGSTAMCGNRGPSGQVPLLFHWCDTALSDEFTPGRKRTPWAVPPSRYSKKKCTV